MFQDRIILIIENGVQSFIFVLNDTYDERLEAIKYMMDLVERQDIEFGQEELDAARIRLL
jgi:hypothetical protein